VTAQIISNGRGKRVLKPKAKCRTKPQTNKTSLGADRPAWGRNLHHENRVRGGGDRLRKEEETRGGKKGENRGKKEKKRIGEEEGSIVANAVGRSVGENTQKPVEGGGGRERKKKPTRRGEKKKRGRKKAQTFRLAHVGYPKKSRPGQSNKKTDRDAGKPGPGA